MARPFQIVATPILMATHLLFGVGAPCLLRATEQRRGPGQVRMPKFIPVDRRPLVCGGNAPPHHLKVARTRRNTPMSGSQRGTNRPRTRRDRQGMHVLRTR